MGDYTARGRVTLDRLTLYPHRSSWNVPQLEATARDSTARGEAMSLPTPGINSGLP